MSEHVPMVKRYYTVALEGASDKTVYDLFEWSQRDVLLKDHKSDAVLTDMRGLLFPVHYSQNAVDIIASKYFRKAGVGEGGGHETSLRQLVHRMVAFWAAALIEEGILAAEEHAIFYDEVAYGLLNQMFAPNSPQWFNTGLALAYGINGNSNDLYYYDPKVGKVVASADNYTRTQASACFILSIEDKLLGKNSISEHFVTETKLFKGGSGTGTNFSPLRAKGERLSGGGVSSGLMSFLKGLDRNAGGIKSGGTTRRAAKMVCLDIDHPEIEDFIVWKVREEEKVRALAKMGYSADLDGEAYETVSGQNSNNSIRLTDEFMHKVLRLASDPAQTVLLKGRVEASADREVTVAHLWDLLNDSAHRVADPAPQFTDTFNAWHTCPAGEDGEFNAPHNRLNSTNPCGEYAFLDDTSCNLSSLNVYRFYDHATKKFDLDGFRHMIALNQLLLEASIVWGQFPTEDIARRTYMFRATGLGMANLASLLMALGLPYDSPAARDLSAALMGIVTGESYRVSALMAKAVGTFEKYALNRTSMLRVIRNHAVVAGAIDGDCEGLHYEPVRVDHAMLLSINQGGISRGLKECWRGAYALGELYGYRNAQVSAVAPTGTISFAMDCAATSIEPFFSHVVYKKLVGGGRMTVVNPVIGVALARLGYSTEQVSDILAYIGRQSEGQLLDGKVEGAPHLSDEHYAVFDTANVNGSGKRFIAPEGHVRMVAALAPLVSGAISKTVNLPREATVDDFKAVHIMAWQLGVKGITLYRDGSKATQPLNSSLDHDRGEAGLESLTYGALLAYARAAQEKLARQEKASLASRREKLTGIRTGRTHAAQIEDVKLYITVNRNAQGRVAEIYMTTDREGSLITGLLNSLSKTISVMLQYNIPAADIARMLRGQKYEPSGLVSRHPYIKAASSISDLISKVIEIELGDYTRIQVKPDTPTDFLPDAPGFRMDAPTAAMADILRDARANGIKLYHVTCHNCSSFRMANNGTCKVCLDCGTTTGCS